MVEYGIDRSNVLSLRARGTVRSDPAKQQRSIGVRRAPCSNLPVQTAEFVDGPLNLNVTMAAYEHLEFEFLVGAFMRCSTAQAHRSAAQWALGAVLNAVFLQNGHL